MSKLFGLFKKAAKSPLYKTRGEEFRYWKQYEESEKMSAIGLQVHKPLVGTKYAGKKPWQYYHNEVDPLTSHAKKMNQNMHRHILVEPVKDWHFFIGDIVEILVGWDKGKIGEIDRIVKERNWVFVGGLNKKRILRDSGDFLMMDGPLFINHEVKLIDPEDMKPTEIEWRYTDEGDRVRVSVRTGRIIPIPEIWASTWEDGINSRKYKDSPKDTSLAHLKTITFHPTNSTFEEDILKQHNLYQPKKKRKTYWY